MGHRTPAFAVAIRLRLRLAGDHARKMLRKSQMKHNLIKSLHSDGKGSQGALKERAKITNHLGGSYQYQAEENLN